MGCGASQPKKDERDEALEQLFRPKRLTFYYQEYRRQLVECLFSFYTNSRKGTSPSEMLVQAAPSSRRSSNPNAGVAPTTHTLLQHQHYPAMLLSQRETKEFAESEEVQQYTKKSALAGDLIDFELPKPPETVMEDANGNANFMNTVNLTAQQGLGGYTFDDDEELTEDELFDKMMFHAAPSKAPSSVASSTVRHRRQQYSANRKTDDIDEAVGYENAGYHADEPSAERLEERINKGLAKAMLNGITGDVPETVCLRYDLNEGVDASLEPFSLRAPSDNGSENGSPSPFDDVHLTKSKHLLCGPLALHALTAHHFVASVGEAVDVMPGLAEDALRMGTQELESLPRLEIQVEDGTHAVTALCWHRKNAIVRQLFLSSGVMLDVESHTQRELSFSGVVEVGSSTSRDLVAKKWATTIIPWTIEQYRANTDCVDPVGELSESTNTQGLSTTAHPVVKR